MIRRTPVKRILKIAAWLLVLFIVIFVGFLRSARDSESQVRSGKLGYTMQAGWINWGHANQDGLTRFFTDLREAWHTSGGKPFHVFYGQRMSGIYWGVRVESILERQYQIESCPDDAALEKIALGIFRETSEAFESMQGEFPNAIDSRSQESSFREGDLRGNLIAFYLALRGYQMDEVRSWLGALPMEQSLTQVKTHPIGKSHSWDWPAPLAGGRLDEVRHDPAWFARCAVLVGETRKNFRFGLH